MFCCYLFILIIPRIRTIIGDTFKIIVKRYWIALEIALYKYIIIIIIIIIIILFINFWNVTVSGKIRRVEILRTFTLIVCAHPYCARKFTSQCHATLCIERARLVRNLDRYGGGGYFFIYKRA